MTEPDPASIGDAGESEVGAKFRRLQWNVWPTNNRDRGTDLIVLTHDENRHGAFGVQAKTGSSYFRSEERTDEGGVSGWWYAESSTSHFDYWTNNTLPHILVLYDDNRRTAYWVHITPDKVKSTGKGCKILVPADQVVDADHRSDLLAVAYSQGHTATLEGTAFSAAAENIDPKQQLRYALIAPRLVAPHRNAGQRSPITAVEAVALLAQGRFRDLVAFAERHPEVPDFREEPPAGTEWAWLFAAAIWNWAMTGSVDGLASAFASASASDEKTASGVVLACVLRRLHSHEEGAELHAGPGEAMELLDELAQRSDLDATDLGWILVQRARAHIDAGRSEQAESDSIRALEKLPDRRDVTATALAGAATAALWGILAARNFEEANVGDLLTASDNAVSWWRSQTISRALTSTAGSQFDSWAGKRFLLQIGYGDAGSADLFAAELNADLVGDHGTWQQLASLKARQRMMSAAAADDAVDELEEGLDALRGSGDESSLESAIVHLRQAGPIEAVVRSVQKIPVSGWTRTTTAANFSALRLAGDLMDEATATDLLVWITRAVSSDATHYDDRVLGTVLVEHSVFGAAAGIMRSAHGSAHQAVAEMVAALPTPRLEHPTSRLPEIVRQLDFEEVALRERSALFELGQSDQSRIGVATLAWLAANNDDRALRELRRRAAMGDLTVLDGVPASALDDAEAAAIIERLGDIVMDTLTSARRGSLSIGGRDNSGALTHLNLLFPNVANWDPIVELLCEPLVLEDEKRSCGSLIIEAPERLPTGPPAALAANIDSIDKAVPAFGKPPAVGLGTAMSIALGVVSGGAADIALAKLASGTSGQRQDAALLLGSGHCPNMQPLLGPLAEDEIFEVRLRVAEAVGRLTAGDPNPQIAEIARRVATDKGVELPGALLASFAGHDQPISDIGLETAQQLLTSHSARVRYRAKNLLNRHSS